MPAYAHKGKRRDLFTVARVSRLLDVTDASGIKRTLRRHFPNVQRQEPPMQIVLTASKGDPPRKLCGITPGSGERKAQRNGDESEA